MSTRSPMNPRSQNREHSGVARKSAASAKPARAAAGSVRVAPSSSKARRKQLEQGESLEGLSRAEKRARKQARRAQEDRIYTAATSLMNQDEDYVKRRRFWWILLICGIAVTIAMWVMLFGMAGSTGELSGPIQIAGVVLAYAIIIGAFVYDIVRIRPLRNYYRSQAEGMSEARLTDTIEKAAAEEERKRAEKAAKRGKKSA